MHFKQILTSLSKRLAIILGGFCFGVLVGPLFLLVPFEFTIGVMFALLFVVILFGGFTNNSKVRFKPSITFVLLALLSISFGVFRYTQSFIPADVITIADKEGQTIRIEGDVQSEVEKTINGQHIILANVQAVDEYVDGKILVRLPLFPRVEYRDHVQMSCNIDLPKPFNGFAYDRYLQSKGVLAICSFPQFVDVQKAKSISIVGMILSLKQTLISHLGQIVGEPHATFLSGLLFGGGSSLSLDLKNAFSRTGTSHILAASGFNVSLFSVAFLGWILSTTLKRKHALILTACLLLVYMITAGATPSILRATIMAAMVLVQHAVRREPYRLNIILLTASIMLIANPMILLYDPGFQLSFVATVSIIYLVPKWKDRCNFLPDRFGIRESFVASLVASVCTMPIVLWHFGAISFLSPFINMLILPLVPYAMALTAIGIISSFIWIPFARMMIMPAWAFSKVILSVISIFGSIDFARFIIKKDIV